MGQRLPDPLQVEAARYHRVDLHFLLTDSLPVPTRVYEVTGLATQLGIQVEPSVR